LKRRERGEGRDVLVFGRCDDVMTGAGGEGVENTRGEKVVFTSKEEKKDEER
jgi:hypothetical protein